MVLKTLIPFLVVALSLYSCKKENQKEEIKTLIVADAKVDGTGWYAMSKCYQVKEQESQAWMKFCDPIEGFDYQEGFEYVIEVDVYDIPNPPQDGSSKRYVLKRIISKK